ncbi:GNAT family N-acetyltransferase [Streptomyces sp. NPDC059080]|uniref:GNAT family N-acetyltransferase n=1 Tax=Streptomyces sp. NPDC059080 TaxID=3346718 RepID=UPI00368E8B22
MNADTIALRRVTELNGATRQALADLYANVRADLLHLPNYKVSTFTERLDRHAAEPGWESVIAYAGDDPVGYAYANTVEPGNRWWARLESPAPEEYTSGPAVAIKEIGIVKPWRGQGIARQMHDHLMQARPELYATLFVNSKAGDGKVQALYAGWGYVVIGEQQPLSPDAPRLTCMGRRAANPS